MDDTAGQWHALIGWYGQHRRPLAPPLPPLAAAARDRGVAVLASAVQYTLWKARSALLFVLLLSAD